MKKEIDKYIDLAPVDLACDPLNQWKKEAESFPTLASLARKYLCLCGTSVPLKHLFSKEG